jgi:hypothetical protein
VKENFAMALTATTEIQPKYFRMTVTGEWALADAIALVARLKEEADRAALRRLFVDVRGIGGARASWMDRSKLGQEIAKILPGFRLVILVRSEAVNHSTEIVANNRGAKMTVKRSEEEAIRWLLE